MLTLETMLLRLGVAVLVGAIIGLERELVGKEAGIRTDVLVSAGSAIFTMVGLILPYLGAYPEGGTEHLLDIIATSRGFSVIAGVVTGIGFLGAGLILKNEERITGVTTAASIWFVAALGILSGIGFAKLALISAVFFSLFLYVLRKIDLFGLLNKGKRKEKFNEDEF
jgi:putative Mg2+ transporter-C (MgtC) family protein